MYKMFSCDDIKLLGYDSCDVKHEDEFGVIFSVTGSVGLSSVTDLFISIKSKCIIENAKNLEIISKRYLNKINNVFIVTQSTGISVERLKEIFHRKIYIHDDLIWEKIQELFSEYNENIRRSVAQEKFYIPPRIESNDDNDNKIKLDQELIKILSNNKSMLEVDRSLKKVFIVNAPAAVGKTTLFRKITYNLSGMITKTRLIPIYLESAYWKDVNFKSVNGLWEIINHAINQICLFQISEDVFEYCLKAGHVCFIFDGFDELCENSEGMIQPSEVLMKLYSIVSDSNAKILLSSRTMYWQSAISRINDGDSKFYDISLASFNKQQATQYLKKAVAAEDYSKALMFYGKLISFNKPTTKGGPRSQFVNLPICVSMIAEYVNSGGIYGDDLDGEPSVWSILNMMCEREKVRQGLLCSSEQQLVNFTDIAMYVVEDSVLSNEFSEEVVLISGFDEEDVCKMSDHVLLIKQQSGMYRFKWSFLQSCFVARYVYDVLINVRKNNFYKIESIVRHVDGNVCEHILEMFGNEFPEVGLVAYYNWGASRQYKNDNKSIIFKLLNLYYIGNNLLSKKEKTHKIMSHLGVVDSFNGEIVGLTVDGEMADLDISNLTFVRCVFINLTINRSYANENTVFKSCIFRNGITIDINNNCGWSKVQIIDCDLDEATRMSLYRLLDNKDRSRENIHNIVIQLIEEALRKFWVNGRAKSVEKGNIIRGGFDRLPHHGEVIDQMCKSKIISPVSISGTTDGGYVLNRESMYDVQKFIDARQLMGSVKKMHDSLIEKLK
ncbi:MAG: NACHT domain-containing protein [Magnetococcales bacterium]|nr:NACHT domain-containing protein [Magnetococcales bacterium]